VPQIEYSDLINDKVHKANRIATAVLRFRRNPLNNVSAGMNVAGYIVFVTGQEHPFVFLDKSTGEGTHPNTHPDQKCSNDMVKELVRTRYLTKSSNENPRFFQATNYKTQLLNKITSGELEIFFSQKLDLAYRKTTVAKNTYQTCLEKIFIKKMYIGLLIMILRKK
jgi:hypothetical protein